MPSADAFRGKMVFALILQGQDTFGYGLEA